MKPNKKESIQVISTQFTCIKCGRIFNFRSEGGFINNDPVCGNCLVSDEGSGVDECGFLSEESDLFIVDE